MEFNDACVRRQGKAILDIDHLVINEGESLAILGPNGAGKSTFVNMITRDVSPLYRDEPAVLFRGKPNVELEVVKRAIGFVSATMQNQIRVHLSSLDVVCGGFFGALGIPKRFRLTDEQQVSALNIMEDLGIANLADQDVMTLSSGQARRVLMARALVSNPSALVMDEPCTGLDPEGMYFVRRAMRTIAQSGRGVILITHYPEDIIPEIGRVVLLKAGRVIADGGKSELLIPSEMEKLFGIPIDIRASRNGVDAFYYTIPQY